jgi:hypothetical protein
MSIPSDPSSSKLPPMSPHSQAPQNKPVAMQKQGPNPDPTGVWTKFLGQSGVAPTPEEVKAFIDGMLKMFNLLIQKQQKAAARANAEMKKAARGE